MYVFIFTFILMYKERNVCVCIYVHLADLCVCNLGTVTTGDVPRLTSPVPPETPNIILTRGR